MQLIQIFASTCGPFSPFPVSARRAFNLKCRVTINAPASRTIHSRMHQFGIWIIHLARLAFGGACVLLLLLAVVQGLAHRVLALWDSSSPPLHTNPTARAFWTQSAWVCFHTHTYVYVPSQQINTTNDSPSSPRAHAPSERESKKRPRAMDETLTGSRCVCLSLSLSAGERHINYIQPHLTQWSALADVVALNLVHIGARNARKINTKTRGDTPLLFFLVVNSRAHTAMSLFIYGDVTAAKWQITDNCQRFYGQIILLKMHSDNIK